MALNVRISRFGWIYFLLSNIFTIALAIMIERYGLLVGQIGFTCFSLLGIYRTGLLNWAPPTYRRLLSKYTQTSKMMASSEQDAKS